MHGVHGETTGFVGGLSKDGFIHELRFWVKLIEKAPRSGQAREGGYLLAQGAVSRRKTSRLRTVLGSLAHVLGVCLLWKSRAILLF